MKSLFTIVFAIISIASNAQTNTDFQIIDISQKEMRIFNRYKNDDSTTRNKVFIDSLFKPYQKFWNGRKKKFFPIYRNTMNATNPSMDRNS
jgi:hypothetical protein